MKDNNEGEFMVKTLLFLSVILSSPLSFSKTKEVSSTNAKWCDSCGKYISVKAEAPIRQELAPAMRPASSKATTAN